jgi:hypothetical protein
MLVTFFVEYSRTLTFKRPRAVTPGIVGGGLICLVKWGFRVNETIFYTGCILAPPLFNKIQVGERQREEWLVALFNYHRGGQKVFK